MRAVRILAVVVLTSVGLANPAVAAVVLKAALVPPPVAAEAKQPPRPAASADRSFAWVAIGGGAGLVLLAFAVARRRNAPQEVVS